VTLDANSARNATGDEKCPGVHGDRGVRGCTPGRLSLGGTRTITPWHTRSGFGIAEILKGLFGSVEQSKVVRYLGMKATSCGRSTEIQRLPPRPAPVAIDRSLAFPCRFLL
jgi:hypothetical protein